MPKEYQLRIFTDIKTKKNPSKFDILEMVDSLDLDNSFIVLEISKNVFCQATLNSDLSYNIENRISKDEFYKLKKVVNKEELIAIFLSVYENNLQWKNFNTWKFVKQFDAKEHEKYNKLGLFGLTLFFLELFFIYNFPYNGSGIYFQKSNLQIEVAFFGLIALWLTLPKLYLNYKHAVFLKKEHKKNSASNYIIQKDITDIIMNIIGIYIIVLLTIVAIFETINIL